MLYDKSIFENKVILITGGSGSIGSYLTESLIDTPCKSVRILSNSEDELYRLQKIYKDNKKLRFLLGDVRDKERMKIAVENVDIVFHAAALKHVPICEFNPFDAIQTNVIGTKNIIDACINSDVEKFVFISTDKAASPLSTLGATKLLAERLTISATAYRKKKDKPIMYCIRFGNVLGTRGSVLEIFQEQIEKNLPITITDKMMTRFAMTKKNAVDLIFSTIPIAKGGEIFVLKMKAIKIIDLAKALITISGKKLEDYKILETGIRDGEKLHEDLITKEEFIRVREMETMYVLPPSYSDYYEKLPKITGSYSSETSELLTFEEQIIFLKKIFEDK